MPLTFLGVVEGSYQGLVRFVDLGGGNFNFQAVGEMGRYEDELGNVTTRPTNAFRGREFGIQRLTYDFDTNQFVDSVGRQVPFAALEPPRQSQVIPFINQEAVWKVLDVDPRTFRPGRNQEIVERNVVVDAQGNVRFLDMSYGKGDPYNPELTGGKWRYQMSKLAGEPGDPGAGFRTDTRELGKLVVHRSFLVKELRPIGG